MLSQSSTWHTQGPVHMLSDQRRGELPKPDEGWASPSVNGIPDAALRHIPEHECTHMKILESTIHTHTHTRPLRNEHS